MSSINGRVAAALVASSALASGSVVAADWQFDPSLELGALASNNYTLARGAVPKVNVAGPFVDLLGTLHGKSPRTEYLFEPRVRAAIFPGDSDYDSNSGYFRMKIDHATELSRSGIEARYQNEYIVDSELRNASPDGGDLGQGGGPDAGRVNGDNRRELIQATPYVQFSVSERTRLRFNLDALDVAFDSEVIGAQQSYRSLGISGSFSRDLTPSSELTFSVNHYRYDPELAGVDSNTNGARLQWDYRVAERVRAYLRAGADRTDGGASGASSETTPIFGAGAQWTFQRSNVFLDVMREVDANSTGFVVERDEVRLWGTHQFTTRVGGYAAIYGVRDEAVRATTLSTPRRYLNGSAGLNWRVRREVTLAGEIAHSFQKFRGESESANGTTFQASVVWRPYRVD